MKKFIVGLLGVFMMLGASILYACTETHIELELSTQTVSIQLNNELEDPTATVYANITGTDDKTLNWNLSEANDVISDVEIVETSDGRSAITITAENVGDNDLVLTTKHGGVQKTIHVEVYTEVTEILNKNEDVEIENKSSRFLVKGQANTLVGENYFTFLPESSNRTQLSWTFEANGTTSYNGAEIVGNQITLPEQFASQVVLRATTHLGVSQTVQLDCIDPINLSSIDIGGAKTETGVFQYLSSGEQVVVEITPNISGQAYENTAYLAVKYSGEMTNDFGGLDIKAVVYDESGKLLSIGSENVDGTSQRLLRVDSQSARPAADGAIEAADGAIEYIFKVQALENSNINETFFVSFNIGYADYDYHISSDELNLGRLKVDAKEKIQKISVSKNEIDATLDEQYLYSNYSNSTNGGFGQLFDITLTPNSVVDASGQYILSVNIDGLALRSDLPPILAYTRSSGAYSEIELAWDENSSRFVSQPISSTLSNLLEHEVFLKANPEFFDTENEAGNNISALSGIEVSFSSVDNPDIEPATMQVRVIRSSGSIEFATDVDQIKINSSSVAILSQTFTLLGQTTIDGLYIPENQSASRYVEIGQPIFQSTDGQNVTFSINFALREDYVGLTNSQTGFIIMHENGASSDEITMNIYLPLTEAYVVCDSSDSSITMQDFSDKILIDGQEETAALSPSVLMLKNGQTTHLSYVFNQSYNGVFALSSVEATYFDFEYDPNSSDDRQAQLDAFLTLYNGDWMQIVDNSQASSNILSTNLAVDHIRTTSEGYTYLVLSFEGIGEDGEAVVIQRVILVHSYNAVESFAVSSANDTNFTLYASNSVGNSDQVSKTVRISYSSGDITYKDAENFRFETTIGSQTLTGNIIDNTVRWTTEDGARIANPYFDIMAVNIGPSYLEFTIFALSTELAQNAPQLVNIYYSISSTQANLDQVGLVDSTDPYRAQVNFVIINADRVEELVVDGVDDNGLYFEVGSLSDTTQFIVTTSSPSYAMDDSVSSIVVDENGQVSNNIVSVQTVNNRLRIDLVANTGTKGKLYIFPSDAVLNGQIIYQYEGGRGSLSLNELGLKRSGSSQTNFEWLVENAFFVNNQQQQISFADIFKSVDILVADGRSFEYAYHVYEEEDFSRGASYFYTVMNDITLENTHFSTFNGGLQGTNENVVITLNGRNFAETLSISGSEGGVIRNITFNGNVSASGFVVDFNNGVIRNVTIDTYGLSSSVLSANSGFVGGIAGTNYSGAYIENVSVLGLTINGGNATVGGVAGQNSGSITQARVEFYRLAGEGESTTLNAFTGNVVGGVIGRQNVSSTSSVYQIYAYDYILESESPNNRLKGTTKGALIGQLSGSGTLTFSESFAFVDNMVGQTTENPETFDLSAFVGDANGVSINYQLSYISYYDSEGFKTVTSTDFSGNRVIARGDSGFNENINGGNSYLRYFYQDEKVQSVVQNFNVVQNGGLYKAIPVENSNSIVFFRADLAASVSSSSLTASQAQDYQELNTIDIAALFGSYDQNIIVSSDSSSLVITGSQIYVQSVGEGELTLSSKQDVEVNQSFGFVVEKALSSIIVSSQNAAGQTEQFEHGQNSTVNLQKTMSRQFVAEFATDIVYLGNGADAFEIQMLENFNINIEDLSVTQNATTEFEQVSNTIFAATANEGEIRGTIFAEISSSDFAEISSSDLQQAVTNEIGVSITIHPIDGAISIGFDRDEISLSPSTTTSVNVTMITTDANDVASAQISLINGEVETELEPTYETSGKTTYSKPDGTKVLTITRTDGDFSDNSGVYQKEFSFRFEVAEEYRSRLSSDETYMVKFLSNTLYSSEKSLTLYLSRQEMSKVDMTNYRVSNTTFNPTQTIYTTEGTTGVMAPGSSSIMQISVNPQYSYYDFMELTVSGAPIVDAVTFLPVAPGTSNQYHTTSEISLQYITNGFRFTPSMDNDDNDFKYNLYFLAVFNRAIPQDCTLTFTATYYAYNQNGQPEIVDYVNSYIFVSYLSEPTITVDGATSALLAKGGSAQVSISVNLDQEIESINISGATNVDYHLVGNPDGEVDPSTNKRVYTYNLYANILATAGEDNRFYVNATVIRKINNNIERKTAQATVTLVDFKIDEDQTYLEGAEDGVLDVYVNVNQTLSLNYMFDPQSPNYDASDGDSIEAYKSIMENRSIFEQNHYYPQIKNGEVSQDDYLLNVEATVNADGTTTYSSIPLEDRIYYVTGTNTYVPIKGASEGTSPFIISVDERGEINIRATTLTQSSQQIMIRTYVTTNGEERIIQTYCTLQTRLYSDEYDLPIMVESAQKFLSLAESEDEQMHDYILMNDIVLESYEPFDTDFISSFDGNGHTIFIRSFNTESSSSTLNLALFDTVASGTTLKNVRVNLYEGGNISVDLSSYTTANIAGFAITNYGIITNCEVVSFYTDQYAIGASGLNESAVLTQRSGDTGLIVTYNRGEGTGEQIMQNTSSWNSSVAGFVLNNNGNITNSRVGGDQVVELLSQDEINENQVVARYSTLENFVIQAQGRVAGFVLQNTGSIAASFVKNLAMQNKSATAIESKAFAAGFVGTSSGKIMTSYVEGVKQASLSTQSIYARLGSTISSEQCVIAGFILTNSGDSSVIENCYSNILISSSSNVGSVYLASGFVYRNEGRVANCYSASQVENQRYSQMNFSGLDADGNLLASGEYENCYYYDQDYSELDSSTGSSTEEAFETDVIRVPDAGEEDYFYGFAIATATLQDGVWAMDIGDGLSAREGLKLIEADTIAHSYRYVVYFSEDQIVEGQPSYSLPYGQIVFEDDPTYSIDTSYGSSQNPIIIRNAEEFVEVTGSSNSTPIQLQYETTIHGTYRLVSDIDMTAFSSQIITLPSTQKAFSGTLYGNGFTITGLSLSYNGRNLSYGLFKSIEPYVVYNGQGTIVQTYSPKITGLNIEVGSNLLAGDTIFVGTLAGYVKDALLINISLDYSNGAMVQGRNFTGSLAGVVAGSSRLKNITVTNPNIQSARIASLTDNTALNLTGINSARADQGWLGQLSYSYNFTGTDSVANATTNLSYAGGVAGYVDIYDANSRRTSFVYTETPVFNVSNIRSQGTINITGQVVGGLFGLTAHQTFVQDAGVTISGSMSSNSSHILSTNDYAGGVIGQSFGFLHKLFSTHEEKEQQLIEDQIASFYNGSATQETNVERGVLDLFMPASSSTTYSQKAIGGLVGQVGSGTLQVSYSNLNVISLTAQSAGGLIGKTDLSQSTTYYVDKSIIATGQYTKYLIYETYASGDVRAYYNNEEGNSEEGNSGGLIGYIAHSQDRIALLSTNAINFFTNIDYRTGQTYSLEDFVDTNNNNYANHVYQFVGGSEEPNSLSTQLKFWKARVNTGTQSNNPSVGYVQSYDFADYGQPLSINLYPGNTTNAESNSDAGEALYQVESISTFTTGTAGYQATQKIFLNSGVWQQSNWSHSVDQFFPDIRYSLADPTTVYLDSYQASIEYVLGLMQTNPTLTVIVRGLTEDGTEKQDVDLRNYQSRFPINAFAGTLTSADNYTTASGEQVSLIINGALFESTAIGFSIENVVITARSESDPLEVVGGLISEANIEGSTISDLTLKIESGVTVTPVNYATEYAAGLIAPRLVSSRINGLTIDGSSLSGSSVLAVAADKYESLNVGLIAGVASQESSTSVMNITSINLDFEEGENATTISFAKDSANDTTVQNLNVGLYFGSSSKNAGTSSQRIYLAGFTGVGHIDLGNVSKQSTTYLTEDLIINAGGYIGKIDQLNSMSFNYSDQSESKIKLSLPESVTGLYAGGLVGQAESNELTLNSSSSSTSNTSKTISFEIAGIQTGTATETAYIGGLFGCSNNDLAAANFVVNMAVKNVTATAANGDNLSPALAVGGVVGYSTNTNALTAENIQIRNISETTGINVSSVKNSLVGIGSLVGYSSGKVYSTQGQLYSDLDITYTVDTKTTSGEAADDLYIGGMIGYLANTTAASSLGNSNGIAYLGRIQANLYDARSASLGGIVGYYDGSGTQPDEAFTINKSIFGGDIIVQKPSGQTINVGGTIGQTNANFKIDGANNYGEVFIDYDNATNRMATYNFGGIVGNIDSSSALGTVSNSNSMVTNHNARLARNTDNANALIGAGTVASSSVNNYYNSAVALAFDIQGTDIGYSSNSDAGFGGPTTEENIIDRLTSSNTGISDQAFINFAKEVYKIDQDANWYNKVSKLSPTVIGNADDIKNGSGYAVQYYVASSSTIDYFANKELTNVAVVGNFDTLTMDSFETLTMDSAITSLSGYSSVSGFNASISRNMDDASGAVGGLVNSMSGNSIIYGIGVNGSMSIGGSKAVTMGGIVGSMTGGLIAESYTNLDMIYRAQNGGKISAIANYLKGQIAFIDYTYATGSVATYIDANVYAFASSSVSDGTTSPNLNISNAYTITKLDLNDYVDGTFAGTPSVKGSAAGTVYYDINGLNYSLQNDDETTTDLTTDNLLTGNLNNGSVLKDDNWQRNIDFNWEYPTRNFTYLKQSSWAERKEADDSTYKDTDKSAYDDYVLTYSYTKVENGTTPDQNATDSDYAYTIPNAGILARLADITDTAKAKNVALLYDIDLGNTEYKSGWTSLYDAENPFTAQFDGQDKTITGLNTSLFGTVSGTIRNLRLTEADVDLTSETESFGLLATEMTGGTISNITLEGEIEGEIYYGAGSLIGFAKYGQIDTVTSMVKLTVKGKETNKEYRAGGIVGFSSASLYYCSNYGPISTESEFAGGIVGYAYENVSGRKDDIHNCFNGGSVLSGYTETEDKAGLYYAGGITGFAKSMNIKNCYNAGMIKAGNKAHTDMAYAAGIAAYASSATIKNCYNEGPIEALGDDPEWDFVVSGAGYDEDGVLTRVTDPKIWLVQTNAKNVSAYGIANTKVTNCESLYSVALNGAMLEQYDVSGNNLENCSYATYSYKYMDSEPVDISMTQVSSSGNVVLSGPSVEFTEVFGTQKARLDSAEFFLTSKESVKPQDIDSETKDVVGLDASDFSILQYNQFGIPEVFVETQPVEASMRIIAQWLREEKKLESDIEINRNYYYDIEGKVQDTIDNLQDNLGTDDSAGNNYSPLSKSNYGSSAQGQETQVSIGGEEYALTSSADTLQQSTRTYNWTYNLTTKFSDFALDTDVSHWSVSNASADGRSINVSIDSIAGGEMTLSYRGIRLDNTDLTFDLTYQQEYSITLPGGPSDFVYIDESSFGIMLNGSENEIYRYVDQSLQLSSNGRIYDNVVKMTDNSSKAYYFVLSGNQLIYYFGASVGSDNNDGLGTDQTINEFVKDFPTTLTTEARSTVSNISASANQGRSFNIQESHTTSKQATLDKSAFELTSKTDEYYDEEGYMGYAIFDVDSDNDGQYDANFFIGINFERNNNSDNVNIYVSDFDERIQIYSKAYSESWFDAYHSSDNTYRAESNFKSAATALLGESSVTSENIEYTPENNDKIVVTLTLTHNATNNETFRRLFMGFVFGATYYMQTPNQVEYLTNNSATSFTYNVPESEFDAGRYDQTNTVANLYEYSPNYEITEVDQQSREFTYDTVAEANAALFRGKVTITDTATYTLSSASLTNISSQDYVYKIGDGSVLMLAPRGNLALYNYAGQTVNIYSTVDLYLTGGETVTVQMTLQTLGNTTTWAEINFTLNDSGEFNKEETITIKTFRKTGENDPVDTTTGDENIEDYLAVFKAGNQYYIYAVDPAQTINSLSTNSQSSESLTVNIDNKEYSGTADVDLNGVNYNENAYTASGKSVSTYFKNCTQLTYSIDTTVTDLTGELSNGRMTLSNALEDSLSDETNLPIILTNDVFINDSFNIDYKLYGKGYAIISTVSSDNVITGISGNVQDVIVAATPASFIGNESNTQNGTLTKAKIYGMVVDSQSFDLPNLTNTSVSIYASFYSNSFESSAANNSGITFGGVIVLRDATGDGVAGGNITLSGIATNGAILKAGNGSHGSVALTSYQPHEGNFLYQVHPGGAAGTTMVEGETVEIINSRAGVSGGVYNSREADNDDDNFKRNAFGEIFVGGDSGAGLNEAGNDMSFDISSDGSVDVVDDSENPDVYEAMVVLRSPKRIVVGGYEYTLKNAIGAWTSSTDNMYVGDERKMDKLLFCSLHFDNSAFNFDGLLEDQAIYRYSFLALNQKVDEEGALVKDTEASVYSKESFIAADKAYEKIYSNIGILPVFGIPYITYNDLIEDYGMFEELEFQYVGLSVGDRQYYIENNKYGVYEEAIFITRSEMQQFEDGTQQGDSSYLLSWLEKNCSNTEKITISYIENLSEGTCDLDYLLEDIRQSSCDGIAYAGYLTHYQHTLKAV